jgi:hypothetical protein
MDTKFINKHKFGIVALVFFILLVSRDNSLDFLIHTILGRLSLILLLLAITSFSVALGIVAVLFVIIMVNKNSSSYLEAFDPESLTEEQKNKLNSLTEEQKNKLNSLTEEQKNKLNSLTEEQKNTLQKMKDNLTAKKSQQDTITSTSITASNTTATEPFKGGREGFNTLDRERVLQTGKNSNKIPVDNKNQNIENVLPFDEISSTPFQL